MEDRVVPRSSKRITQKYKPLFHKGVDIGWSTVEENNKIHANCKGIVYEIQDNQVNNKKSTGKKTWGNYVYIKHPNGMFTRYAHLKIGIPVKVGQEVDENTIVGIMGNSGYCGRNKAYHLHFIVWKNGVRVNPRKHVYVYDDNVVAKSNEYKLLYYHGEEPIEEKKYIKINARSGVWCRKGIGFKYPKYKAIPYGTKCELLEKNVGTSNGYKWDKIIYNNEVVYLPNKWNIYL